MSIPIAQLYKKIFYPHIWLFTALYADFMFIWIYKNSPVLCYYSTNQAKEKAPLNVFKGANCAIIAQLFHSHDLLCSGNELLDFLAVLGIHFQSIVALFVLLGTDIINYAVLVKDIRDLFAVTDFPIHGILE